MSTDRTAPDSVEAEVAQKTVMQVRNEYIFMKGSTDGRDSEGTATRKFLTALEDRVRNGGLLLVGDNPVTVRVIDDADEEVTKFVREYFEHSESQATKPMGPEIIQRMLDGIEAEQVENVPSDTEESRPLLSTLFEQLSEVGGEELQPVMDKIKEKLEQRPTWTKPLGEDTAGFITILMGEAVYIAKSFDTDGIIKEIERAVDGQRPDRASFDLIVDDVSEQETHLKSFKQMVEELIKGSSAPGSKAAETLKFDLLSTGAHRRE